MTDNKLITMRFIFVVLFVLLSYSSFCQFGYRSNFSRTSKSTLVGIGAGPLSYYGDIAPEVAGSGSNFSDLFSKSTNFGYSLTVDKRFGAFFGGQLNITKGMLAGEDGDIGRKLNFHTKILQAEINCLFHFEKFLNMGRKSQFFPYVSLGGGILMFDPMSDMKDANGKKYYYWTDDQNYHDKPYNYNELWSLKTNLDSSNILERDNVYETALDSLSEYQHYTFTFPVGIGFKINLKNKMWKHGKYFNLGFNWAFYFTFNDNIDGKNRPVQTIIDPSNSPNKSDDYFVRTTVSVLYDFNGLLKKKRRGGRKRRYRSKF